MTQRSYSSVASLLRRRGYLVKQDCGRISVWDRYDGHNIFWMALPAEIDAWLKAANKREARAWR